MHAILFLLLLLLSALGDSFRGRAALQLELIAVRHQPATMKRNARRPSLRPTDRLLWVLLSRLLLNWREMLVIVKPETVIGWHRKGFRLYWSWESRRRRIPLSCHRICSPPLTRGHKIRVIGAQIEFWEGHLAPRTKKDAS